MIIWLASFPRSGNTYFRILLKHFYGINTYSLYQDKEIAEQPEVRELVGHLPRQNSLAVMAQAENLFFVKTHELPQDNFPAIYLVRDGRDVLLSYAWYILTIENPQADFEPTVVWETLRALINDSSYFGGWGPHVLLWTRRQAPTAIVKFEDLVRTPRPLHIVKQTLHHVGYQPPEAVTTSLPPTFAELHQVRPQFFRRGQIDGWKTEMPTELHDLFWQKHGYAMGKMGYTSAIRNSQATVVEERILSEEKKKGLIELSAIAKHRLQLICQYENELTIREEIIRTQQEELVAKEQIIQELHTAVKQLEASPLRPLLKSYLPHGVQDGIRNARRWFQPKLGQLYQHPPIPLKIPKHYHTTKIAPQQSLPVVSIVTPSLNQVQFLEHTIRSVLDQKYPKLEYILQDGASTDGTDQIVEKYRAQFNHVESCQDTGQANAINLGFSRANGEIMAWINSDDLLLPGTLAYVVNFFLDHPEVDVVYGHRIIIDEQDNEIGRWILPPHDDTMLPWADYIPQETLFWRRRIWEKTGGYIDESHHFALDWELLLRFRDARATFVRLPRFLAAFRVHVQQKTSRELDGLGKQEMTRLRKHYHGREVSELEALHNIRRYMVKHLVYETLYRWKLFRF